MCCMPCCVRRWRSRAAINRAMKAIPDNSLVAILSTSDLLLPSSTDYTSPPATLDLDRRTVADGSSTHLGRGQTASDVFVAYERMQYATSVPASSTVNSTTSRSLTTEGEATGTFNPLQGDSHGVAVEWYDHYGRIHHRSTMHKVNTLLVTASSSGVATDRASVLISPHIGGVGNPSTEGTGQNDQGGNEEASTTPRSRSATGRPPPAPRRQQEPDTRFSNVVSFPLLVFDTQTFLTLGELDERFAFQGGIADWISRAKLARSNHGVGVDADVAGCCCDASPFRHRRSRKKRAAADRGTAAVSDGLVPHVHDSSWGGRFVRPWPENDFQPRCPTSNDNQRPSNGVRRSSVEEQAFRSQGAQTSEDIVMDQWTRLSRTKLEARVQADADLFFLPLMMLPMSYAGKIWRWSCGRFAHILHVCMQYYVKLCLVARWPTSTSFQVTTRERVDIIRRFGICSAGALSAPHNVRLDFGRHNGYVCMQFNE